MQHHTTIDVITTNINETIRLICQYIIRRAFKLFDNETRLSSLQRMVGSLRLTSKSLNKSICDELSLEIMHRWMKGLERAALVTKRINQFLQKCDYTGLFTFMAVVVQVFARRDSVRLLSSFLITITQHHKHILKDYITFFTSRRLHMTIREYYAEQRNFPFPGFKPEHVEKALQIANENGWIEESIFILDHFIDYYATQTDVEFTRNKIRSALQNDQKLNFRAKVANRLDNARCSFGFRTYISYYQMPYWMCLYLDKELITTTDISKVLHSVSSNEASQLLWAGSNTTNDGRVITFNGSQLIRYCFRTNDPKHQLHQLDIPSRTKDFTGLPATPETTRTVYLYYYYRAIVESKLDLAKQIELEHGITLEDTTGHPHPLSEYLNYTSEPKQEMVDYLIEKFGGVDTCLQSFERKSISDPLWALIRELIPKGAIFSSIEIWRKYFYENVPRNGKQLMELVQATEKDKMYGELINFLLDDFREVSKQKMGNTYLLLLLAWKYGDKSCLLTSLPKEILLLIMKYADLRPLYIELADALMENTEILNYSPLKTLESSGEITKFVRRHCTKMSYLWTLIERYPSFKIVRRDLDTLKDIMLICHERNNTAYKIPRKFVAYLCKYETDEKFLKILVSQKNDYIAYINFYLLEYALAVKNIRLVNEFYKQPHLINELPTEFGYATISKKNKPSFAEALQLAQQIRFNFV